MKYRCIIRRFFDPLLLIIFVSSCNGQTTTRDIKDQRSIGEPVKEMDKKLMIIFQDKNNNYWFGSNEQGAYRYDGKKIVHFTTNDGLCHNQIRGIQEDKTGNIYFTTDIGINKFDGQNFTTLIVTNSPDSGWKLQPGDLWFRGAQDSGVLYRYDGTTLYRLKFPKTKSGEEFIAKFPRSKFPRMTFSPYDIYSIYKDRKGTIWFGTEQGVCHYDGRNLAWISEKELGIDAISFHVRSTIEDKNGRFWFSNTMHRFYIYANDSKENGKGSVSFRIETGIEQLQGHDAADFAYFLSGIEDASGDLWLVTYNKGVWRYDGKNMTHYLVKDGDKNVTLFTIYKDNKGELWLGTHEAGAYKFNGKTFEPFRPR